MEAEPSKDCTAYMCCPARPGRSCADGGQMLERGVWRVDAGRTFLAAKRKPEGTEIRKFKTSKFFRGCSKHCRCKVPSLRGTQGAGPPLPPPPPPASPRLHTQWRDPNQSEDVPVHCNFLLVSAAQGPYTHPRVVALSLPSPSKCPNQSECCIQLSPPPPLTWAGNRCLSVSHMHIWG